MMKRTDTGSIKNIFAAALTAAMMLFAVPAHAQAVCSNPAGTEGAIVYNLSQNVPQVCTPLGWVALGALNPSAGGGGSTFGDPSGNGGLYGGGGGGRDGGLGAQGIVVIRYTP